MTVPATRLDFKTMMIRDHELIPVRVTCDIIGESHPDREQTADITVTINGEETSLCTSEELEIKGIIWDHHYQQKKENQL